MIVQGAAFIVSVGLLVGLATGAGNDLDKAQFEAAFQGNNPLFFLNNN